MLVQMQANCCIL